MYIHFLCVACLVICLAVWYGMVRYGMGGNRTVPLLVVCALRFVDGEEKLRKESFVCLLTGFLKRMEGVSDGWGVRERGMEV